MRDVSTDSELTCDLLARVRGGDRPALDRLLAEHRPYLRRLVEVRFNPQLRPRVDPSDVVQDALLEAAQRIDEYLRRDPMPFWLWLRQTTCEQLVTLQRGATSGPPAEPPGENSRCPPGHPSFSPGNYSLTSQRRRNRSAATSWPSAFERPSPGLTTATRRSSSCEITRGYPTSRRPPR